MTQGLGSKILRATGIVALCLFASCTRLQDSHGYVPDDPLLDQIVVGVDTKETAQRILGNPGTAGVIDDRGWYYVKSDYERFLWRAPVEVDREVVVVSFTDNDVVENVERYGLEDGQVVALSRRVTTANTQGVGFLRQFFSNLGNFDAGQFLGDG